MSFIDPEVSAGNAKNTLVLFRIEEFCLSKVVALQQIESLAWDDMKILEYYEMMGLLILLWFRLVPPFLFTLVWVMSVIWGTQLLEIALTHRWQEPPEREKARAAEFLCSALYLQWSSTNEKSIPPHEIDVDSYQYCHQQRGARCCWLSDRILTCQPSNHVFL